MGLLCIMSILVLTLWDLIKASNTRYGSDGKLTSLPLDDKTVARKEHIIQVYIVIVGLFLSNFYDHATQSDLKPIYLGFFCCALIYYIYVSKCETDLIRRFLCVVGGMVAISFSIMLMKYLNFGYEYGFNSSSFLLLVFMYLTFQSLLV